MNQRQASIRTRTNRDPRRYYLRLAVAAVFGFMSSLLDALAFPGDIQSSHVRASPAPVVWPFVIPFCALFLVAFFLLGETGYWTARRKGTIRSGVLAAAIAGACFGFGEALGVYVSIGVSTITSGSSFGPYPGMALLGSITGTLTNALTFGIVGAIAGGIGAAIGRSQYRMRRNELTPEGE